MSRTVKPTLRQKKVIDRNKLDSRNWLVCKETNTELKIVCKASGKTRTIKNSA